MPATPAHLSVSIVLHNSSLANLRVTMESLERAARAAIEAGRAHRVTVYLVDNASAPGYRSELEAWLQRRVQDDSCSLVYRPLNENRGFGAGHNAVITALESDYHLVLNPDVELAEEALSRALAIFASQADIALLSPGVRGPAGQREYLCKRYPSVLVLLLRGFAPPAIRRLFRARLDRYEMRATCGERQPVEVELAGGCFMMAPSALLREVGGFDERYFLYFEDFDLSLRLRRHGRALYHPGVRIVHRGGYAARKGGRHIAWFAGSAVKFFNRHGWRWV
ncbi:MAG: glycosyltransferase family 2 protein [Halioglobus sp.]|nr:glycosyltransferase family 2 protein [Halioglobus sp.]